MKWSKFFLFFFFSLFCLLIFFAFFSNEKDQATEEVMIQKRELPKETQTQEVSHEQESIFSPEVARSLSQTQNKKKLANGLLFAPFERKQGLKKRKQIISLFEKEKEQAPYIKEIFSGKSKNQKYSIISRIKIEKKSDNKQMLPEEKLHQIGQFSFIENKDKTDIDLQLNDPSIERLPLWDPNSQSLSIMHKSFFVEIKSEEDLHNILEKNPQLQLTHYSPHISMAYFTADSFNQILNKESMSDELKNNENFNYSITDYDLEIN